MVSGCGTPEPSTSAEVPTTGTEAIGTEAIAEGTPDDACAHVIDASVGAGADGTFTVEATVRSADTGWDKYADAWEVLDESRTVLGTRVLAHPHETEQPFTRSLSNVEIPPGVEQVTVRARDSVEGFCGAEFEVALRSFDEDSSG